ncbi:MAG: hypothetical protein ACE5FP_10355 [Gemmatimonadota bacterium]
MATVEFIAILVSIVVGLAMAEVLQGFADALRHRSSVRGYWPLMVYAALTLTMAIWTLRWLWLAEDLEVWTWGALALALAPGLLIFLMARMTFPQQLQGSNLQAYYFEHSRVLWGLAAVFVSLAALRITTLGAFAAQSETSTSALILRSGAFLLCIVLAVSKRQRVHEIGLGVAIVLMIARIATSYVAFGA